MPLIKDGKLVKISEAEITNDIYYIPEDVEIIEYNCFSDISYLKHVVIPDSVVAIEAYAFFECMNLENVKMSENIESIGDNCFENCSNLKRITLPDSITKINYSTFNSCISLTDFHFPSSLTTIYNEAFYNCLKLDNIKFRSNLKHIMSSAFFNNISLKKIELLNKDMVIDDLAFSNCYDLREITVSNDIKSISNTAFFDDSKIKRINIVLPDKILTFDVNYGISPVRNTLYKLNDIFCINQNDKLFLTIDSNGNIKKFSGDNFNKIFYSGLLPNMHYISNILNNKSVTDFDYNIVNVLPCKNDIIKPFYQSKNEWFDLLEKYDFLKQNDLSILFDFCYTLGLFSPREDEKIKAKIFINNFISNPIYLSKLFLLKPFLIENGYNKHFASCFMGFFTSLDKKDEIIESFPDIYMNFDKICELTTMRKIKERTNVHSKINEIKKSDDKYTDNIEYKNLVVREIILSKMIKNKCKSYITFEDYLFYKKNIGYEFSEKNNELNEIKQQLKGNTTENLNKIEKFWEYAKDNVSEENSAFIKVKDNENNKIKYEMLDRLDPLNLVIGDLVNCCSTVNNYIGFNIAKECILNDEVKCIILRNENNEIIGKTTCYFNRKEKYMLLNNFELSDKFMGSTYYLSNEERLRKRKEAISAFTRFIQDEINVLNSLEIQKNGNYAVTKAYVGMRNNDLEKEIEELYIPIIHSNLLENTSFGDRYEGDANSYGHGQCIIYDNDLDIVGGKRQKC